MVMNIEEIEDMFKYVLQGEDNMMVWTSENLYE